MSIIKWKGSYLPAAILIGGLGIFLLVYLASNRSATLEATLKTGERLARQGRAGVGSPPAPAVPPLVEGYPG